MATISTEKPKDFTLHVICMECNKVIDVSVNKSDYEDWRQGLLIQKAFPYLSAEMRELLISHICPECWNKLFPEDE